MTIAAGPAAARPESLGAEAAPALRYRVETIDDIAVALQIIVRERLERPTPFQSDVWLKAWHAAFIDDLDARALFVVARDAGSGRLALILPLARRRLGRLITIEAADFGVTDYNAPLLGPAAPLDRPQARALWRAIRRALPPHDLFRIEKAPRRLGERPNPLALLPAATPSQLSGNVIDIDQPFDSFLRGFERKFRKEIGREKRVFESHDGARFEILGDFARAETALKELAHMQARRIRDLGLDYRLDGEQEDDFYRRLLRAGFLSGVTLSALHIGEEMVAALLGIVSGDHYAMVRLAQAGPPWSHFSPGRLVILETMRALHAQGVRRFDFTIGDYAYKRRLGVVPQPLVDLVAAGSWRGLAPLVAHRARVWARGSTIVAKARDHIRARPSPFGGKWRAKHAG